MVGAKRKSGGSRRATKLPHVERLEPRARAAVADAFLADTWKAPIALAVSRDFFELFEQADAHDQQARIYAAYEAFYEQALAELSGMLGKPVWSGGWRDRGYPRWASGGRIAVWEREGEPFVLALNHEDKELPIVVELRWGPAPGAD